MRATLRTAALLGLICAAYVLVPAQSIELDLNMSQAFAASLLTQAPSSAPPAACDCNPTWQETVGNCTPLQLPTPWSCEVDPTNPWPEYPRPQMTRPKWVNLNGPWQWQPYPTWESNPPPFGSTLQHTIIVPYPIQSDLSGVPPPYNTGVVRAFYRRTFSLPNDWTTVGNNSRVLMHFDAVNWEAEVWVNQQRVGMHQGGYDRFTFDITDALLVRDVSTHEVVMRIYSPLDAAHIPIGKQRLHVPARSIFYSASSGIWQTVWLELVPGQYITSVVMIPDIDNEQVSVTVHGSAFAANMTAQVQVTADGKQVSTGVGSVGQVFNVSVPNPHLWSPSDPFLYNVTVSLTPTAQPAVFSQAVIVYAASSMAPTATAVDTIGTYLGMRKISLNRTSPTSPLRIFLNNNATLQVGLLDQGYWPDGIYTPATEEALLYDMRVAYALGFTTLRKHMKVEPDRYYHHADRLGMLIWQDMPAMYWEDPFSGLIGDSWRLPDEKAQFRLELQRMVSGHIHFPSIIIWTLFNEGWGQFDTVETVRWARTLDSSRLWDPASGWLDPKDATSSPSDGGRHGNATGWVGDVRSDHNYPNALSSGATADRASVCSEFGGLGLFIQNHEWISGDWQVFSAYPLMSDGQALQDNFLQLMDHVAKLFASPQGLSAAIYTQVSDIEAEVNGMMTYDRKVVKMPQPLQVRQKVTEVLATAV